MTTETEQAIAAVEAKLLDNLRELTTLTDPDGDDCMMVTGAVIAMEGLFVGYETPIPVVHAVGGMALTHRLGLLETANGLVRHDLMTRFRGGEG